MVTHVFRSICSSSAPSWRSVALIPLSARYRNALPSFRGATPSLSDLADQNVFLASRACAISLNCSNSLVTMMYQLPIDMIARMISVPRETKSPPFHKASMPYGFSTDSLEVADSGPGVGVGAAEEPCD